MNNLRITELNGKSVIDSREVAEMIEMRHTDLLRKVTKYEDILTDAKLRSLDFFVPNEYRDTKGETRKCYLLTKMGCEMVANKLTGEKGVIFTAKYVEAFNAMEKLTHYPTKSSSAGEVASVLRPVVSVMNKQGSKPNEVAKQVELTLNHFGIPTIENFVKEPTKKIKQLSIAFVEEEI